MTGLELAPGPLSVVCLAAHPDDIEIGAGGLLLALAASHPLTVHQLTLAAIPVRAAEADRAGEAFAPGSRRRFLDLPDGRLPAHWDAVKQALHELAAEVPHPDLVLAPHDDDAHQDHRLVGSLARTVWRNALLLHYEIPKWDGDMHRPNLYAPLSPVEARRKVELLDGCYLSQRSRDWWDEELFLGFMRVRGMECHSRYAEAFTVHKAVVTW